MTIDDFIRESNAIEEEYSDLAITDSYEAYYYLRSVKKKKLGLNEVLDVHSRILKNLRPDIAGKLRNCNVQVGGRLCPPWIVVKEELIQLLNFEPYDALSALNWHVRFEKIHPFEDGNGRTGRLLYAYHCDKLKLQWMIFRANDRWGYYSLFDEPIKPKKTKRGGIENA